MLLSRGYGWMRNLWTHLRQNLILSQTLYSLTGIAGADTSSHCGEYVPRKAVWN